MKPTTRCGQNTLHGVITTTRRWSLFSIRLSTILFGQTEFGVRALRHTRSFRRRGVVYLVSWHLFGSRAEATFAGLLFCSMLLISAGAIIVTPDTPLLFFWSIGVYALVRLYRNGVAGWWAIIGVAMGLALQSKYTALLLGAGIVGAMAVVPRMRRWWQHPAPYLAAALAFAIFLPVIGWNYHHNWASFAKQMGRVGIHGWGLRYVAEFAGSQVGLLTPFVFCLAAGGVWIALRSNKSEQRDAGGYSLTALIAPMTLYFLFHSLHARVQGNWLAPAYPIFAVLGAQAAFHITEFGKRLRSTISLSRRLAVPVGLCIVAIAYISGRRRSNPPRPKERSHRLVDLDGPVSRAT